VKPGDQFLWKNLKHEQSLRSQAHKQGCKRGVIYKVNKRMLLLRGKPIQALVVTLTNLVL
jgi:hypothetical protein